MGSGRASRLHPAPSRWALLAAHDGSARRGHGEQQPIGVPSSGRLRAVPALVLRLHLVSDGQLAIWRERLRAYKRY